MFTIFNSFVRLLLRDAPTPRYCVLRSCLECTSLEHLHFLRARLKDEAGEENHRDSHVVEYRYYLFCSATVTPNQSLQWFAKANVSSLALIENNTCSINQT